MRNNYIIPALSFPLGVLVIGVSLVGLYVPDFYSRATFNWQVQTLGQDMVDLLIVVPCMLISTFFAYRNNKIATTVWGGSVFYLAYTFTLYCFNVHFNQLFIAYCLCLGLSVYSTLYCMFILHKRQIYFRLTSVKTGRYVGVYFILIALLFYALWLSEIIPANMQHVTPPSLKTTGLMTNGVQVLDLAILLPAMLVIGVFLWKGSVIGFVLAPILLVFSVLMNVTIGFLQYLMVSKRVANGMAVVIIMLLLALIDLYLLLLFFKKSKVASS